LIIDSLADYAKETGIDLSKNPFAANLEQWRSPEDILQLLENREKAFKGYRDENRRLINCLSPVVNVFHKFSGILSEVAGLVSRMCCLDYESFNVTLSDPLLTGRCFVCWNRYSPRCMSLEYAL
jgi:hypothetical protein